MHGVNHVVAHAFDPSGFALSFMLQVWLVAPTQASNLWCIAMLTPGGLVQH